MSDKRTGITVFSGGTAANSLVDVFNRIIEKKNCRLNYIIPISDNGGSSSELIRFIGGPSVGDIRSRLVRLIPNPSNDQEKAALKALFEYRLPGDPSKARIEWLDMVEARHLLWAYISSPKRELIRSILNTLNLEIVKRTRPTSTFNFAEASIGNMFLTGARIFSGSFESAIYLLSMICSIPPNVNVLPAINSNFTHHISAGLGDGTTIAGQVAISHPSAPTALPDDVKISLATPSFPPLLHGGHGHGAPSFFHPAAMAMAMHDGGSNKLPLPQHLTVPSGSGSTSTVPSSSVTTTSSSVVTTTTTTPTKSSFPPSKPPGLTRARSQTETEDASLPGSLPSLRTQNISFSKSDSDEADQLSAGIERVWYINPYGHEIWPNANPKVIDALAATKMVVYSIGSLWTSIVPSLVLRGVGEALAGEEEEEETEDGEGGVRKVLVLNATIDRETGPKSKPMTATDFVRAVAKAGEQSRRSDPSYHPHPHGTEDNDSIEVDGDLDATSKEGKLLRKYVTHLIYLDGQQVVGGGRLARTGTWNAPKVDVRELEGLGIKCVGVEGRVQEDGKEVRYDEGGLGKALEGIIDE